MGPRNPILADMPKEVQANVADYLSTTDRINFSKISKQLQKIGLFSSEANKYWRRLLKHSQKIDFEGVKSPYLMYKKVTDGAYQALPQSVRTLFMSIKDRIANNSRTVNLQLADLFHKVEGESRLHWLMRTEDVALLNFFYGHYVQDYHQDVDDMRQWLKVTQAFLNHPSFLQSQYPNSHGMTPLYIAAEHGHDRIFEALMGSRHSRHLDTPCSDGTTPLLIALQNGNYNIALQILQHENVNVNWINTEGVSAFHLIVQSRVPELLQALMHHPMTVNINQTRFASDGATGFLLAIGRNDINTAQAILAYTKMQVDINQARTSDSMTPLLLALHKRNLDIVKAILPHCETLQVNQADSHGNTPLYLASYNGYVEVVNFLIKNFVEQINWNTVNSIGLTSLNIAVLQGHLGIVKIFLNPIQIKSKINVGCTDPQGNNILHLAIINGHISIVEYLLTKPLYMKKLLNQPNNFGGTPLMLAVENEKLDIIRLLISQPSIRLNQVNHAGDTLISLAIQNKNIALVDTILSHVEVDFQRVHPRNGMTVLCQALRTESLEVCRCLLTHPRSIGKIDVNGKCPDGNFPLILATDSEEIEIFDLLLAQQDIDVNQTDYFGVSALCVAVTNGRIDVVQRLLGFPGLNINQKTHEGKTPFYIAASSGFCPVIRSLLEALSKRSDIDIEEAINAPYTHSGNSPLHAAAQLKRIKAISFLLEERRVNLISLDHFGATPFYRAVESGNIEVVRAFLRCAQEQRRDIGLYMACQNGNRPLDIARIKGYQNIIQLLHDYNLTGSYHPAKVQTPLAQENTEFGWNIRR